MTTITKWALDPAHSELLFKVKHMMIANVKGEFRKFSIEAESDGQDFVASSILVRIDAASIFTNNEDRDKHLRSADFFDAENSKELVFRGKSIQKTGADGFLLTGDLTIRNISKEITLDVEFGGINKDPYGRDKAGFSVNGTISRKDWGLIWNVALEAGGVLVSDEVRISAEVQLTR
jgi:polyisoprenoid-binding protein YceI